MKKITKYNRPVTVAYLKTLLLILILGFFFFPNFKMIKSTGDNMFEVTLNGTAVGVVENTSEIDDYIVQARKMIATKSSDLVLLDPVVSFTGKEVYFGQIDLEKEVVSNMYQVLKKTSEETRKRAYTVKINEYIVNIDNCDDVQLLLQAALNKYDLKKEYGVELILDPTRELNVLTTSVYKKGEVKETKVLQEAGVGAALSEMVDAIEPEVKKDFDDFDYGLIDIGYGEKIEIVESYLTDSEITPVADAIAFVTKDQDKNTIYEVVAGDTLSEIAIATNIPLDKIIEMNETLDDENSTIRVGDELIITIPEPELSIERLEEVYYEENYDAPTEYVYNDEWYTTDSVTRQQPSAGHRKVVADVNYRNDKVVTTTILKEDISMAAVPKIVEIGTKTPPTYLKPISGGRMSSVFGKRWGKMHKGIDWATPVGTAVVASSTGTVVRAGWASGYGYVVYINHSDGRQTRYGHLSKVLVKVGDSVKQGQKIALSGNTGRSTGPHIHFEILINGSQVNPLEYMN